MKIDNSNINTAELLEYIHDTFQMGSASSIQFIPKGEEGYCYSIQDKAGKSYFVKAIKTQVNLEKALFLVKSLHHDHDKKYILAPIPTHNGNVTAVFGEYQISLFPFIQGASIYEGELTLEDTDKIAAMMADFHNVDTSKLENLPIEKFENPFENKILELMNIAKNREKWTTMYQKNAMELLLKEKDDIHATLKKMKTMQKELQAMPLQIAITHGDPNYANIMKDDNGNLYLIDFGAIGIGPIERDLMAFSGNEFFHEFLSVYVEQRSQTRLNIKAFEFYLYMWSLQEISDYGMQLFFGTTGESENQHAWTELQPYLPIPHHDIQKSLDKIEKAIKNLERGFI